MHQIYQTPLKTASILGIDITRCSHFGNQDDVEFSFTLEAMQRVYRNLGLEKDSLTVVAAI
jgi:hypothetical protein